MSMPKGMPGSAMSEVVVSRVWVSRSKFGIKCVTNSLPLSVGE